jgi:hypothetical protein
MALVGSGTPKVKNFYAAASLSSADMDESFAAFVEQIGGVKWLNGAASRAAGNLTYQNFASGMALGNQFKREPRGVRVINLSGAKARDVAVSAPIQIGAYSPSTDTVLVEWCNWLGRFAPALLDPPITFGLYLNGDRIAVTSPMSVNIGIHNSTQPINQLLSPGSLVTVKLETAGSSLTFFGASSALVLAGVHV